MDGTKALEGWSDSGSFCPCYDRTLPIDALLGAATFDAHRPESYLNAGVYEPSNSSYRSRWFCITKKDGKSLLPPEPRYLSTDLV